MSQLGLELPYAATRSSRLVNWPAYAPMRAGLCRICKRISESLHFTRLVNSVGYWGRTTRDPLEEVPMPWMPEVFTTPIAEARRTRKGREHQRRRSLPRGIMAVELNALLRWSPRGSPPRARPRTRSSRSPPVGPRRARAALPGRPAGAAGRISPLRSVNMAIQWTPSPQIFLLGGTSLTNSRN